MVSARVCVHRVVEQSPEAESGARFAAVAQQGAFAPLLLSTVSENPLKIQQHLVSCCFASAIITVRTVLRQHRLLNTHKSLAEGESSPGTSNNLACLSSKGFKVL